MDVDLANTLLWLTLLTGGVHPQGHNIAGDRLGIPVHVNYSQGVEEWSPDAGNWRNQAALHAGGFEAQNLFQRLIPDDPDLRYANALYKLLYPVTVGKTASGRTAGDIENLERVTGNKKVGSMIAADAFSDLFFDDLRRDISFRTENGVPVLMFNMRF